MKITIIQGAFFPVPPILGGAVEKLWFSMAKEFSKLGHKVYYVSRSFPGLLNDETSEGIQHKRVRGYSSPRSPLNLKLLDLFYSMRAVKQIRLDSDVVVTNTFWSPILAPHVLRNRVYVSVERMPKGQMRFYRKVGRIRANSTPVAAAIQRELPNAPPDFIRLIPNPLPFTVNPTEPLCKKNTILYCGRVHPEKGLGLLIDAFANMPSEWGVRIVGPWQVERGGGGEVYLKQLKERSKGSNIEFIGPIYEESKLAEEYQNAAVFVYPSVAEKGESFGLAPLEAMAWGGVPIVSSLECFQDFITHERNGLIFDHRSDDAANLLAEALRKLIQNPSTIKRLSNEAVKVRETHSSLSIANQFLADFELIANASQCLE